MLLQYYYQYFYVLSFYLLLNLCKLLLYYWTIFCNFAYLLQHVLLSGSQDDSKFLKMDSEGFSKSRGIICG